MCLILKSEKDEQDSFIKLQLILGPVFRAYIKLNMQQANKTNQEIDFLTSIQEDTARYNALTMPEAAEFFYGPLGIVTNEHQHLGIINNADFGTDGEGYLIEPTKTNILGAKVAEITVYYQHRHFEILSPAQLNHKEDAALPSINERANAERNLLFNDEAYSNRVFGLAYENFSSGEPQKTKNGLVAIQAMVYAKGCDMSSSTQDINYPSEFHQSAIEASINKIDYKHLITEEFSNKESPLSKILTQKLLTDYQSCGNKFLFFAKNTTRIQEVGTLINLLQPILNLNSDELSIDNRQFLIENILKTKASVQACHERGSFAGQLGLTSSRLVTKLDECLTDLIYQGVICQQDIDTSLPGQNIHADVLQSSSPKV